MGLRSTIFFAFCNSLDSVCNVAIVADKMKAAASIVVVDSRGLTVDQDTVLRRNLRESGVEFKVIKNSILSRAAEKAGLEDLKKLFVGPSAVAFSNEDVIAPAKVISEFAKGAEALEIYQLLLFHFQEKNSVHFFDLIEQEIAIVNPIFQMVFKTFLKDKDKVLNAMELPYSYAKLEATNNLIKVIKRNAFGFRNFENFKKRILIALN